MRVNVESKVLTDARFKIAAQKLGISWHEVLGRVVLVWMAAYEKRSAYATRIEIDAVADIVGFAYALIFACLARYPTDADLTSDWLEEHDEHEEKFEEGQTVLIAGIRDHVAWLHVQDAKREKAMAAKRAKAGLPGGRPRGNPPERPSYSCSYSGSGSVSGSDSTLDPDQARDREGGGPRPLPDDWEPLDSDVQEAKKKGLTDDEIADQMERFIDWAKAKARVSWDWNAEWRVWISREVGWLKQKGEF